METNIQALIPISEHNGKKAVSARLLHAFLESKQDFSNWIQNRIKKYGLIENQDYQRFNNFIETGGRSIEYALSMDCAKELAMVEGNAKGKQARQYFIACEQKLKEVSTPLSQLEILQQSVNLLVVQERRLDYVENQVSMMVQKQMEAEKELKALPVSTEEVPKISLRDKIRLLINRYCSAVGMNHQAVWDNIYQTLYYNYHVPIKSYHKLSKNETWLEVAERKGHLDKIYVIASNLLRMKGLTF
jgi:phage anti-repressor protein